MIVNVANKDIEVSFANCNSVSLVVNIVITLLSENYLVVKAVHWFWIMDTSNELPVIAKIRNDDVVRVD